jgi:hypothetical protein
MAPRHEDGDQRSARLGPDARDVEELSRHRHIVTNAVGASKLRYAIGALAYVTLDAFYPIVVARRVGRVGTAAVEKLLHWFESQLARDEERIAVVYDAGNDPDGAPDSLARAAAGRWLHTHQREIRRACVGIDFAFPSRLSRGALTAVFWIAKPPVPYAMHATNRAALEGAISRVNLTDRINADALASALIELERAG